MIYTSIIVKEKANYSVYDFKKYFKIKLPYHYITKVQYGSLPQATKTSRANTNFPERTTHNFVSIEW